MQEVMKRRRFALYVCFVILGLVIASWITQTPVIRDAIQASLSEMGMVLFGLSVGAMSGVLLSGRVIRWQGTKFTTQYGLLLVTLSLLVMTVGVVAASQLMVACSLFLFGFGMGSAEIAINMDAGVIEHQMGKPIMHYLHGCFSLGVFIGSLVGLGVKALALPVTVHLTAISAVTMVLLLLYIKDIPAGLGKQSGAIPSHDEVDHSDESIWLDKRLPFIFLIVFALALAEGAAYDWLPILLIDEYHFSAATGSLLFVLFAALNTIGRFSGGLLLNRFGRLVVVRCSILLAAIGVAIIVFAQGYWPAGLALVCWGFGVALVFPLAFSAAAEGGGNVAGRVKAVATVGYIALLVGPPSLGFIAQSTGLRGAMGVVLTLIAVALLLTQAMKPLDRSGAPGSAPLDVNPGKTSRPD